MFNHSGTSGSKNSEFNALEQAALETGVFLVCSAGNDGYKENSLTGLSRKKIWLSEGDVQWGTYDCFTEPLRNGYFSYDTSGDDCGLL